MNSDSSVSIFSNFCFSVHACVLKFVSCLCFYVDQKDESFYTVCWACSDDGSPYIVAGGSKGIIRVIDSGRESIYRVFWLK